MQGILSEGDLMRRIGLLLLVVLGPALSESTFGLFQDMWHWRTNESPEFATQVGINDNTAGRLDSFSNDRFDKRKAQCEEMLIAAKQINEEKLSPTDKINLQAFTEMLQEFIDNYKFVKFFTPMTSMEGPHLHLPHLVTSQMTLESYNDFQKLLARYGKFPRQADQILDYMKQNVQTGIMPHNISMEGILEQLSSLDVPVVKSTFFTPFLHLPRQIPASQRRTLRQQAEERIAQDLFPSYNKLKEFLQKHYLGNTRLSPGISSLTDGVEYYHSLLGYYTSTKLSPEEIHSIGLSEIKRLRKTLQEGNVSEANTLDALKEPGHYFNTEEELLEAFRTTVFGRARKAFEEIFDPLTADNLTIRSDKLVGLDRRRAAWYEAPSLDGTRHAKIHINKNALSRISKYEVLPLSLRLSYPGQHLHAIFLQETPSVPHFRKILQASRWSLIPSELPHNEAFAQGWALYSESLSEGDQLYTHPLERLMRTNRQLVNSAQLVVDTGIHSLGWSAETASEFFKQNTALSEEAIKDEIKRIVTWPGQACSSKVGEIKLRELRQRAQNALGEYYSSKEFHRILLECTNPFHIVEECISKYISDNIQKHLEEDPPSENPDGSRQREAEGTPKETGNRTVSSSSASSNCYYKYNMAILLLFYASTLKVLL